MKAKLLSCVASVIIVVTACSQLYGQLVCTDQADHFCYGAWFSDPVPPGGDCVVDPFIPNGPCSALSCDGDAWGEWQSARCEEGYYGANCNINPIWKLKEHYVIDCNAACDECVLVRDVFGDAPQQICECRD